MPTLTDIASIAATYAKIQDCQRQIALLGDPSNFLYSLNGLPISSTYRPQLVAYLITLLKADLNASVDSLTNMNISDASTLKVNI